MIRIVTDSTCDLSRELIEKHRITVIPMYIHIGDETFIDGVNLSREEFYSRLPGFKHSPTTAAPGPDVFRQAYEKLAREDATEILSIHISPKLSAVFSIASQAASGTSVVPVTAFDSHQLSLGIGFEVLAAAEAAEAGASLPEIIALLEQQIKRTRVIAALDTLEFLRRSGRMNFAISFLGTLLQIKPFMKMYDGNPTAERIRTHGKAIKRLVELFRESAPYQKVALLHSEAAELAHKVLAEVRHLLPEGEVMLAEINPVLGAHIGPGVVGFATVSVN